MTTRPHNTTRMTRLRKVVALTAVVAVCSFPLPSVATAPSINQWCPVMTEEKVDPEITTVFQGKTVAFCCDRCLAKFLADPERYVGRLPQFADSSVSATGGGRESHEHEGHTDHPNGPNGDASQTVDIAAEGHHLHDESGESLSDLREPWLGRIHPLIVHFPLAGMPLALLGFLVWLATGREAFARADVPPLLVATLAAIAAVITGNIAYDAMRFSDALHVIVERHQFVSTTVMVLAIGASALRIWRWNRLKGAWRWLYAGSLAVACGLLGVTGYLGGSLVFGPDHLRW